MIQLSSFLWIMVFLFAFVGLMRGWTKEIVATAGIVLALFTSWQFSNILIQPLTQGASAEQIFFLYTALLMVITFFAYQTPSQAARMSEGRLWGARREGLQERILGFIIGGINGYLVFGSIWYYLEVTRYPFSPYIVPPSPGSASAGMVAMLPLVWLVQNNFLTIAVIVLFLFVIIAMI